MYQGTKFKIECYLYFQQKSRYGTSKSCCQVGLVLYYISFQWLSFSFFHLISRKISVSLGVNNFYSFRRNPINLYIFEKLHALGIHPNWNFVKRLSSVTSPGQKPGVGEKGQKKYSKMAYFSRFIEQFLGFRLRYRDKTWHQSRYW